MKKSTVISLEAFRKKRSSCPQPPVREWPKGLPDARDLWDLMDHNVSVHLWRKRAE